MGFCCCFCFVCWGGLKIFVGFFCWFLLGFFFFFFFLVCLWGFLIIFQYITSLYLKIIFSKIFVNLKGCSLKMSS